MTRKAFLEDLALAAAESIPGVADVKRGEEHGEINFTFTPALALPFVVNILITDVQSYPASNQFVLYTLNDVPTVVNEVLEYFRPKTAVTPISQLIGQVTADLQKALATGSQKDPYSIDDDDCEVDNVSDNDTEDEDELFSFGFPSQENSTTYHNISEEAAVALNKRIVADLRAAKFASFKIGILSGLMAESSSSLVSLSVQVAKLGLSDEAIQAWDLQKHQYVVLLIRYAGIYKTFETIIQESFHEEKIEFRIGVCNRYKPDISEALAAFSVLSSEKLNSLSDAGFLNLFVSSSLNEFMNDQFLSLLKIRHAQGTGWDGANRIYRGSLGNIGKIMDALPDEYYEEPPSHLLPPFVTADHLLEHSGTDISLPLIAMQFAMHYLVRCTEYCLICHDKTEEAFEAMKPYVCSKPLCLYQYMALGFGPSIEHEILTQPYVVDLLVSFCYTSAKANKLQDYPSGMSLTVPNLRPMASNVHTYPPGSPWTFSNPSSGTETTGGSIGRNKSQKVKYDQLNGEIIFGSDEVCSLRRGDWVVLTTSSYQSTHYRVDQVLLPTVKLSKTEVTRASPTFNNVAADSHRQPSPTITPVATPPLNSTISVNLDIYDINFDDLPASEKCEQIVMLLETLPSIQAMRTYLTNGARSSTKDLRSWGDRISPAALGLLRWIVASNRSCIVQIDKCPGQDESDRLTSRIRLDQKVTNMPGYVQFRFAQGAPDKEHRFQKALLEQSEMLHERYPTIFAWHGSSLANWHSIIRSGLNFEQVANGRAFGDGCYHSQDLNTSLGYSQRHVVPSWPGSALHITQALCLNEIVNLPLKFQSHSPHLVVQFVDWIQCRYLFVNVSDRAGDEVMQQTGKVSSSIVSMIEQDPKFTVKGSNHQAIGIPTSAIATSRAISFAEKQLESNSGKRRKLSSPSTPSIDSTSQEVVSDEEDSEDLAFFLSTNECNTAREVKNWRIKGKSVDGVLSWKSSPSKASDSLMEFVPGSLNRSTLKLLKPPEYATSGATQTLTRELAAIMKAQQTTPLAELGWYVDQEVDNNVYQWIVELHSFDRSLPLAADMEKAGISSVVLEIRFGKDYPMSPPFIRVIRPRFLPFMHGGGGHVTGGGAMCMELLTNSGWSAVSSIESVLLQVRMAIMNLEPKPARLEKQGHKGQQDYGISEAMDAYVRACNAHGWQIPKDFKDFRGTEEY